MVSDEQLIQDLKAFADELGETPTTMQMRDDGPWSIATYYEHFDDWEQAIERAGLSTYQTHPVSKQQLLEDLQEFADEIGQTPSYNQMNENGPWSAKTYENYFDHWNRALKMAKLENNQEKCIEERELISDLREFADEIQKTPTAYEMMKFGPRSAAIYAKKIGSWNQALKEAELEPIQEYPVKPEWGDDVDDYYGESWPEMREKAVQRDDEQCRVCGDHELLNVHHIKPRRCFEDPDESNTLDNLITLCSSCHGRFENRWTDTDPDGFEAKARELLSVA